MQRLLDPLISLFIQPLVEHTSTLLWKVITPLYLLIAWEKPTLLVEMRKKSEEPGITPRATRDVFVLIRQMPTREYLQTNLQQKHP